MVDNYFEEYFNELSSIDPRKPQRDYLLFHRHRYKYLMHEIAELIPRDGRSDNFLMLDVGPAYQTYLIRQLFDVKVNTLGFDHLANRRSPDEVHFPVDLNQVSQFNQPIPEHDLIIFSEVIEHLFTPVEEVMEFILRFLKPGGYLILQTPNAVCTFKRLRMLLGYHPYEPLRETRDGHFREYTLAELDEFFIKMQMKVVKKDVRNYFNYPEKYQQLYRWINDFFPFGFRDGITLIGRKK